MEFTVERDFVLPALERMSLISKNEKRGFAELGWLFIRAKESNKEKETPCELVLAASNGYVKAVQEVKSSDGKVIVAQEGTVVVNAASMRNIVKSSPVGSSLKFWVGTNKDNEEVLYRTVEGQKRKITIPTLKTAFDESIPDIDYKHTFTMKRDTFVNAMKKVLPWAGVEEYRPQYSLVYLEFRKNESRFVCGDGSKFVILSVNDESNSKLFKNEKDCFGTIFQSDQTPILVDLLDEASNVTIRISPNTYRFDTYDKESKDKGITVVLDGIPKEYSEYVPYTVQWERLKDKVASIEIDGEAMLNWVSDLNAVKDAEWEKKHNLTPVNFGFDNGEVLCKSKFTNSIDCVLQTAKLHVENGTTSLMDAYSLDIFSEITRLATANKYEFSFMGHDDIVFCQFPDEEDKKTVVFFSTISQ